MGSTPEDLAHLLEASVSRSLGGVPGVSIAFSGGLDSSLVALLASRETRVQLLVASGPDRQDLVNATGAADVLGLPLEVIDLNPDLVLSFLPTLIPLLGTTSPLVASFELPLRAVLGRAPHDRILTGQGADELFGGYARYQLLPPSALAAALQVDLDGVLREGAPREMALAKSLRKHLIFPYLDEAVVAFARELDPGDKVHGNDGKIILRRAAIHLGLHPTLANRGKKAAQYGSGAASILRALARNSGMAQEEYLRSFLTTRP